MISESENPLLMPPTRRETIREALLERIGDGTLPPGERIIEARMAEEFGVSAIPVREAIRELISMGMLDSATNKGAWVREVGLVETIEALEVKAALEAQAAVTSARRFPGECRELRQLSRKLVTAARRRDFAAYQRHNQTFHRAIVTASGNRTLLRLWEGLAFEVRTRPIMEFLRRKETPVIARAHAAIVDALEAGDGGAAATLLVEHVAHLVDHLKTEITRENGTGPNPARPSAKRKRASASK